MNSNERECVEQSVTSRRDDSPREPKAPRHGSLLFALLACFGPAGVELKPPPMVIKRHRNSRPWYSPGRW